MSCTHREKYVPNTGIRTINRNYPEGSLDIGLEKYIKSAIINMFKEK